MANTSQYPIELTICLDSCNANDNAEFDSVNLIKLYIFRYSNAKKHANH